MLKKLREFKVVRFLHERYHGYIAQVAESPVNKQLDKIGEEIKQE